ncbi:MAG: M1 family metallopeptidase, partial [Casimicrobiaceae bacterium]
MDLTGGIAGLVAAAAFALIASAPVDAADSSLPPAVSPPAFRLPAGARPLAYDLTLTVVPGAAKSAGEIVIDVDLDRTHPVLWLNADTLTVSTATVATPATRVSIVGDGAQFVGLAFDPPLPAGKHRVTLAFEAEQSTNSTRGIFALQDGGAWYTMTQFEAISARKAFPSFDEPGFKTPWRLTLRVPRDLVAIANTQVESENDDGDGLKTVRFKLTLPLPTYLVAFAVGPWQSVDLGRLGAGATPSRIVVPAGRTDDTSFAAQSYSQLFTQLERWFGIPYPFDKLDHIAIPLTVGFAMENAGLITYGAPLLLAKRNAATPRFRRNAANIGAHEIAHQWFGNLVTPAWWDDIWLNEAFATWIAEKAVERWRPDYYRGAARVASRAEAIDADVLTSARRIREPVNARSDIFNAFDRITYEKGATVIGMFEAWMGEEPFRRGVQSYLEARAEGSATSADFLDALSQASRLPVAPAFDTFLNQNGVPQVDVRLVCDKRGATLALTQHRLTTLGSAPSASQRWQIPVCARVGAGGRQVCTLMRDESEVLSLGRACPGFVFANAGGRGYYVPYYREDALDRIARHRALLSVAEFASLLDDLRALVRAGAVSPSTAMAWVRYGAASRDWNVLRATLDLAEFYGNTLVTDASRPVFAAFAREVFGPRARTLGFVRKPGESDDDQLARRALLRFVAPYDPELAAQAHRLALAWIADRKAVDAGLVDVVLVTAARTGDAAMLEAMVPAAKSTQDRLERRNLTMALLSFDDPALAQKGLEILLDPSFDVRETWTALRNVHAWNPARRAPHDFVVANFDALARTVGRDAPGGWPRYAAGLCSETDRPQVEAFWAARANTYAGAQRELAAAIES